MLTLNSCNCSNFKFINGNWKTKLIIRMTETTTSHRAERKVPILCVFFVFALTFGIIFVNRNTFTLKRKKSF